MASFDFYANIIVSRNGGSREKSWKRSGLSMGANLDLELKDLFLLGKGYVARVLESTFASLVIQNYATQAVQLLSMRNNGRIYIETTDKNLFWRDSKTAGTYKINRYSTEYSLKKMGEQMQRADLMYFVPISLMIEAMSETNTMLSGNNEFLISLKYVY